MLIRLLPVLGLALLGALRAGAQTTTALPATGTTEVQAGPVAVATPQQQDEIFAIVDQKAAFKGDLNTYLADHMKYPDAAVKAGRSGRVYLSIIITDKGLVDRVVVAHSSGDASLDAEAIRVVNGMNNPGGPAMWRPAKNNGMTVNCFYTLPVTFKLD